MTSASEKVLQKNRAENSVCFGVFWKLLPTLIVLAALGLGLFLRYYRLASIPPLLWYDEAFYINRAREVLETGRFLVYFKAHSTGAHPILVYLITGGAALFGITPISGRIVTALAGTLAVPLIYLAGRDLLADLAGRERARWLAAFAALIHANLFWNVALSRVGFESIVLPLFAIPAFHLFGLGLKGRGPAYFAGSGVLLGLSLYVSPHARLLPITVVVIAIAYEILRKRDTKTGSSYPVFGARHYSPLGGLLLAGLIAVLVFAPLGSYFLQHPEVVVARARTATYYTFGPGAESVPLAVLRNLGRTLAGISFKGDLLARHNLPGRSIFDPILSVFFWLGLLVALRRARRDSSMVVILGWTAGMMLSTVLSDDAPNFTRGLAAAPAMILLVVVGTNASYELLRKQMPKTSISQPVFGSLPYAMPGLALVLSFSINVYDYFVRYANHPGTFDSFTAGEYQAAEAARSLAATDAVYLTRWTAADDYPNFELLLKGTSARGFDSGACLPYQPVRTNHYLVNVIADQRGLERLSARFPGGAVSRTILHQPEPFPLTEIFTVPSGAAPVISNPLEVRLGEAVVLLGLELTDTKAHTGETLTVTLIWEALRPPDADLVAFLHLASDPDSPPLAQHDSAPCSAAYPTYLWRAGEVVFDLHPLSLPGDLPPGRYALFAGMYSWPEQALLGKLRIAEIAVSPPSPN